MTTIKYNTGTEWIDVHTTYKATETTHGVAKIATSKEVSEGTNDESFVTPKKLQEVVATLPIESEVVHKGGEETIVGLKTFSGNDDGVGNIVINNPSLGISDEVDSTPQFGEIEFTDKDGTLVGSLDTIRGIDDGNGYNAIRLSSANGEGISAHTPLELRNYDDGIVVAVAPTPNESANGSEVITAEWIQPKLEAESKARTDEDTRLAGLITAEETARTNADNNLQQQITKEVEDRTNADNNLQQQITTNLNSINTINQNIETINETLEIKQDQLTESQLAAVNSGVTSATVTQVATNVSNIVDLQNKKADKETTYTKTEVDNLLSPKATTEYVDGEVDKLEQSITTNVNTINTRIDNEVSTINNTLDTKADKSDTYTKEEVDAKVSSVYRFKGSVDKVEDLPKEGNVEGDVYNVTSTGENYAWVNATDTTTGYWDDLGGDIDLTPYLTKAEAQTTYETIANVNTLSTKLDTKVSELNESITTNVNTINTRIDNEVKGLEDAIALKSDKTYVDEQLALKADKSDTYTKTEVDNLLEPKATTEYVDGQIDLVEESITTNVETINDRIDTEVETLNTTITTNVNTINTRIDNEVESINSALDLKADITYVDGQIDLVEESITTNVETLNKAIDLKADKETTYTKTEVDNLLSPKATTEYVDGEVDKLEQSITTNVETLNKAIDLKADKTEIPTKVSELENDSGYLTSHQDISGKADITYVDEQLALKANASDVYTKEQSDAKYLTEHQDLSDYALKTEIKNGKLTIQKNGTEIATFTANQDGDVVANIEADVQVNADWNATSGVAQILNKPTNVSAFTNDAGYLTQHQDISGKADTSYVDEQLGKKADKSDTYTKAEVDAKVSSVYRFKGSVANYDALPTEGNVVGDVYNVEDTGDNYAWTEEGWDKLAGTIDLTPYLTKEEAQTTYETIANVNTLKETVNTKANASDVYTKTEVDGLVSPKADKTYVDEQLELKADKETTYTKTEVDELIANIDIPEQSPEIIGGTYIDVKQQQAEMLYEYVCHPMIEQNMGAKLCNNTFASFNSFDYEGIDMNAIQSLEQVANPVSEFYMCKIPTNLVSVLVPMYHEDKSVFQVRDILTDVAYQMFGAPDTTDESKDALLNAMTGGFVDPSTPTYFIKLSGIVDAADGTTEALMCAYQDINGEYILCVVAIWSITPTREIQIGQASNALVVDWNQTALDMIRNIDSLPSQTNNAGKFLTTNGTFASWAEVDALPSQTDNAGKMLTTDGNEAKWEKFYPGVIRVWE